jgi:hypothetical protein
VTPPAASSSIETRPAWPEHPREWPACRAGRRAVPRGGAKGISGPLRVTMCSSSGVLNGECR